jgi:hypothetical protein
MHRTRWLLVLGLLGCTQEDSAPSAAEPEPSAPSSRRLDENAPSPTAPVEPPPSPTFDGATIESVDATVVEVLAAGAGPCGILHSVGALLVEVHGAGDPHPRLVVYVSCPADIPHRGLLEAGQRVHIDLHARKQSWPKPPAKLPEGVPVRYAKKLQPLE